MILKIEERFMPEGSTENYWDFSFGWVGHPRCDNPGELEMEFIKNRSKLEVIGGVVDATLSYEYDDFAIVRYKRHLYLLETSGCSCPSPTETWRVIHGPMTKREIIQEIKSGNYRGYTLKPVMEEELLKVVEAA